MGPYEHNCKHTASFTHRTGPSTLSYDKPAQCYCYLLSTDGSRSLSGLSTMPQLTIVHVHLSEQWDITLRIMACYCCLLSLDFHCFLNLRFPVSFPDIASSNDVDNSHGGSVAVHCVYWY